MEYRHVERLSMRYMALAAAAILLSACADAVTLPTAVVPSGSMQTLSTEQDSEFPVDSTAPSGSGDIVMLRDIVTDVPAAIRKLAAAGGGHVLRRLYGVKGFLLSEVPAGAAMALASNPVVELIEHNSVSVLASSQTLPSTPEWWGLEGTNQRGTLNHGDAFDLFSRRGTWARNASDP